MPTFLHKRCSACAEMNARQTGDRSNYVVIMTNSKLTLHAAKGMPMKQQGSTYFSVSFLTLSDLPAESHPPSISHLKIACLLGLQYPCLSMQRFGT